MRTPWCFWMPLFATALTSCGGGGNGVASLTPVSALAPQYPHHFPCILATLSISPRNPTIQPGEKVELSAIEHYYSRDKHGVCDVKHSRPITADWESRLGHLSTKTGESTAFWARRPRTYKIKAQAQIGLLHLRGEDFVSVHQ
jgi:hypothetical protein